MPLAVSSGRRELPWTATATSGWWTPVWRLVQAYNRDGELLAYVGGPGRNLGQFNDPMGIAIDQNNRMFVSEQYPWGRVQQFRYITDAEADQLKKEKAAGHEAKPTETPQTAEVKTEVKK